MLYVVTAKPKSSELARFWDLLNDGTIRNQEPDGREIIASMKRATVTKDGVQWSETCYCNPPLRHERTTIYDQFFSDIEIQPQTGPTSSNGEWFWQFLKQNFGETPTTETGGSLSIRLRYIPLRIL